MKIDDVPWKDLETRGFVHIPAFLSPEELAAARADYTSQPIDPGNQNYALSPATERSVGPLFQSLTDVLTAVRANTTLKVDRVTGGAYFATKRGIVFKWHQDHESYFEFQNHFDYLNFYIPVFKPQKDKSNLCVLPFDDLARQAPRTHRRVVRGGASWTYDLGGRQLVIQDQEGAMHLASVDLDSLSCTPELEAGDLLLMRGDVFHRTQDNDTDRVALSVRAIYSKTIIRRAHLADGGVVKASMMAKHRQRYAEMFRTFGLAGRDELPLDEFQAAAERLARQPASASGSFRSLLLREKVRNGVLLSSIRKALNEVVVRKAILRYRWLRLNRASAHRTPAARHA